MKGGGSRERVAAAGVGAEGMYSAPGACVSPPALEAGTDNTVLPRDDFDRDVWCVLGLPFDAIDTTAAVARIRESVERRRPLFLSTPNLNFVISSRRSACFRESVVESELSLADGMPIVWVSRILGVPLSERVSGSGVMEALRQSGSSGGGEIRVFFFGGEEGRAEQACVRVAAEQGGLSCVGHLFPGFGSVDEMSREELLGTVNASDSDFVVVALGAEKGQAWIMRNRAMLRAPVIAHLGAVVNFVAGGVRRAPELFQRLGLEWLWRIKEEPALWRRYWRDARAFLRIVVTRVIPYAVWLRLFGGAGGTPEREPAVTLSRIPAGVVVTLDGRITAVNRDSVRETFRTLADEAGDVTIDMSGVEYVDAAFLGLLLLLRKHIVRGGGRLSVIAPSARLRRLFVWNSVEYLLS